jgi:protein AATF/BFR2
VDTQLNDKKYRGKSTSRKDLFERPAIIDNDDETSADEVGTSDDDEEGTDIPEQDGVDHDTASVSSSFSGLDSDEDLEDSQSRHDKVRQLLAQETKYIPHHIISNSRTITEQLSESTQADAEKGRDIKTQQVFSTKENKSDV